MDELGLPTSSEGKSGRFFPVLTIGCVIVSVALFAGINLEDGLNNWDAYKKWGAPSAFDIFSGRYWGILTSNFLHVELWHIAFNLYWFWFLGKKIEQQEGNLYFGILVASSGVIASAMQMAFSNTTGIGLSGICYGLFGFILMKRKDVEYRGYLDQRTIYLFIFWLLLCVVLTQTKVWVIGNAAHVAGLLWGIIMAWTFNFSNPWNWLISAATLIVVVSFMFWTPFSTSWLSYRAYDLHLEQNDNEAKEIYLRILDREPENEWARKNLLQIEIKDLQDRAYKFHIEKNYSEAKRVYNQILSLDKENQWAKENLKTIPD